MRKGIYGGGIYEMNVTVEVSIGMRCRVMSTTPFHQRCWK